MACGGTDAGRRRDGNQRFQHGDAAPAKEEERRRQSGSASFASNVMALSAVLNTVLSLAVSALAADRKTPYLLAPALFAVVTAGAAVVFYLAAKFIRRAQGVNIDLAYAEVPPE